jgi:hypothetical protein
MPREVIIDLRMNKNRGMKREKKLWMSLKIIDFL